VLASPTTSPSATTSGAPQGEAKVSGLIASVAGNAAQVNQQSGTATVDFTDSTKVTEVTSATLTDVAAGSCVSVRSKDGNQTATSVRISPAAGGNCAPAKGPAPSGTPTTGPGKHAPVQGTVASVAGNTITINTAAGAPQTVTVTDKTKYTKEAAATSQAIAAGKCITAKGGENGGVLQATTISLRPANNGKCPEVGGGSHRH
jgi:hypothetical protein